MKVQKVMRAQGDFAKINEDIKDKDLITILDAGQIITGNYGDQHVFKIKTRSGEKNLSFNQTSMNNIIEELGDETNNWIGKEVKVWLIMQSVSGQMKRVCYLTGKAWDMAEDNSGNINFVRNVQQNSSAPAPTEEKPATNVGGEEIKF